MLKKQALKTSTKITFSLPKNAIAGAKEVRVLGEFNNWDWAKAPVMKASKTNYTATMILSAGKQYQFRYLADNGIWENDWAADNYIPSEFSNIDNSVVAVPAKIVKEKAKTTKKATAKKAVAKKVSTKKATAKKVVAKKTTKADDLKKVEGIGPKIAGLLNADGIITFADLAKAPIKQLKTILDNAGSRYRMHDPKTWSAQAKLAAKGNWEKLKAWQGELKGGK
ncbi:MAG: helix-hairpin-helix domain-containing protein [Saprospiraceae bacterium]